MREPKERSLIDMRQEFEAVKDSTLDAVQGLFPIVGKQHSLRLDKAWIDDNADDNDLQGQLQAKLEEKTWGVPVMGQVSLVDSTGKTLDKREVRLADLPKPTPRMAYLVGGQEFQLDRQWRLKPGVYTREKETGGLEAHINTSSGDRMSLEFDPSSRKFGMKIGGATMPLYPVLRAVGVPESDMLRSWGPAIYDANSQFGKQQDRTVQKLYKKIFGREPTNLVLAEREIRDYLRTRELDPQTTRITLGTPVSSLEPKAWTLATKKLLTVARGESAPDNRDNLAFKRLYATEDFVGDRVKAFATGVQRRLKNAVDKEKVVDKVVYPGILSNAVKSVFTDMSLARTPTQDNPISILEGNTKTTILGPGGISDAQLATDEAKAVDESQVGFIDPIDSPESSPGLTTHLSLASRKRGNDVRTEVYDLKKGVRSSLDPVNFLDSVVALPDSVRWSKGKPVPVGKTVRALGPGNRIVDVPFNKVDYVIPSTLGLFGPGSSLVPFLGTNSALRVNMAARHMSQAVPLKYREAPLVRAVDPAGSIPAIELPGALAVHKSTVDGTVTSISRGKISIRGKDGKSHTVQIYDHFPLNEKKTGIHAEPIVKVGDSVRAGQAIADTSFSRNGELALGVPLRVGYIPIPGKTFEDAIVVSETGSKKLTSTHLHRHYHEPDENTKVGTQAYAAYYPMRFNQKQLGKLDSDGVIREGEVVEPGDPLTVSLREQKFNSEAKAMARLKKSLVKPFSDMAVEWDHSVPGRVVRVHKMPDGKARVFVSTEEPAQVADKVSGVFGNKGTIVEVRPDAEMPKDKEGKPIEMAINPYGVGGRMNPGQIYELAAGKIAQKTGKPYLVPTFEPDVDWGEKIRKDLAAHNLDDREELYDPKTGKLLGKITTGPLYILKQRHMVERKISARSGGPGYSYDIDRQPRRGGQEGAQSFGGLGNMALLAHGARNIMRESATYKSDLDQQDQLWRSIQMGQPLPPPKTTFAQKKFEGYLNTLGVRLKKTGTRLQMVPMRDEDVLASSNGEITKPNLVLRGHDLAPETGGLFDIRTTGGLDGTKMSHIKLPEKIPNPFFERGVLSLTGLTQDEMLDILAGKSGVRDGKVVKAKEAEKTGSEAISSMLRSIDVDSGIRSLRAQLPRLSGQQLDRANKKLRYLEALKQNKLDPESAYMTGVIPVLPPSMRPIIPLPSGDIATDPLNETYKALGTVVESYKKLDPSLPARSKGRLRKEMYTSLAAMQGIGAGNKRVQGGETQGVLDLFTQPSAKSAWVQTRLFKARQDLSARSVIVPDADLSLDEIGIPHRIATTIYKPFVVRELTRAGYGALEAEKMLLENHPAAEGALRKVVEERPVLAKRDPVLHKYGIQAFKPRIDKGFAIKIHPLVTGGYNADFDGDTMSLYVPITSAAVEDAKKMMPSRNLLSPATGKAAYTPSNEMSLGIFRAAKIDPKAATKDFPTVEAALEAHRRGEVGWETIKVGGRPTTIGRIRVYNSTPEEARSDGMLWDADQKWNSSWVNKHLASVAKVKPQAYGSLAQDLMNLGFQQVYDTGVSLSVHDLKADKESRERAFSKARVQAKLVEADKKLRPTEKDEKLIEIWSKAGEEMEKEHWGKVERGEISNTLSGLAQAGVKPGKNQYKQIYMSPVLVTGVRGKEIPNPITKSFAEGLDTAGFWLQSMGGRQGLIKKTQEVRDPGYLSKQLLNTIADSLVLKKDCGTTDGISLSVDHPDIRGRYTASALNTKHGVIPAGTPIDSNLIDRLRKDDVSQLTVRSPLRCQLPRGMCSKCYGKTPDGVDPDIGTNIGVIAGQAVGERSTQLMLKAFHTGGVKAKGASEAASSEFERVVQALRMPQNIRGTAVLAETDGEIIRRVPDPAGGIRLTVKSSRGSELEHHIPGTRTPLDGLKVGAKVTAGSPLSSGVINPHDLLRTAGLQAVQNQITNDLDTIYGPQGILRRNIEVVSRGVTNLARVEDAGGHPTARRGDSMPISVINDWNANNPQDKIKFEPILKGIGFAPLELTEDWVAKLHHERLKETLVDAALEGHESNISGINPFSARAMNPQFGLGISGETGAY